MPKAWRVGNLTIARVFMGICELVFCVTVFVVGKFRLSRYFGTSNYIGKLLVPLKPGVSPIMARTLSARMRKAIHEES